MNFSLHQGDFETGSLLLSHQEFVFVNPTHILSHDPTLDIEKGVPDWMPLPVKKLLSKSSSEPVLRATYGKGQAILTTGFPGKLTLHRLPENFRVRMSSVVARDPGVARKISQSFGASQQFVELEGEGDILVATRGSLILIDLDFDQVQNVSAAQFVGLSGKATIKMGRNIQRVDAKSGQWAPSFHVVTGPGTIWMQSHPEPVLPGHFRRTGKK